MIGRGDPVYMCSAVSGCEGLCADWRGAYAFGYEAEVHLQLSYRTSPTAARMPLAGYDPHLAGRDEQS